MKFLQFIKDSIIGRDSITNAEDLELKELLELTADHYPENLDESQNRCKELIKSIDERLKN